MDPSKPRAIDGTLAHPPLLPLQLVELILAIALQTCPKSTTYLALARVLPPSQVPLAYTAIFCMANASSASSMIDFDDEDDLDKAALHANDAFLGLDFRMSGPHPSKIPVYETLLQLERHLFGAFSRAIGTLSTRNALARPRMLAQALVALIWFYCSMGDVASLQRAADQIIDRGMLLQHCGDDLFMTVSETGSLIGIQSLFSGDSFDLVSHNAIVQSTMIGARNGHALLVDDVLNRSQNLGFMDRFQIVRFACIGGHTGVLERLLSHFVEAAVVLEIAWRYAAQLNHVHVLAWLKEKQIPEPDNANFGWADWASKNGHLEVLNWFYDNTSRTHYTSAAVEWASEEGRLNVIEWWLSKTDLVFKFSPGAMWQAHRRGSTNVSQFWGGYEPYGILLTDHTQLTDWQMALVPRDPTTLASFGRLDLLLHFGYSAETLSTRVVLGEMIHLLENVALFGHIHVFEYLKENSIISDFMSVAADYLVAAALPGDRVNVVQWLLARFPFVDDRFDWSSSLVELVRLEARCVLEWLFRTGRCKPPVSVAVLKAACHVGDVAILNLLFAKGLNLDALQEDDLALIEVTRNGHVSVLQWWIQNGLPVPRSTRPIDYASQAGKRIVLDWWLHESGKPFLWSEAAIRWAVKNKQINVAQWWLKSQLVKDSDLLALLHGV